MEQNTWRPCRSIMEEKIVYESPKINAPQLSGFALKAFVFLLETPLLGNVILSYFMRQNRFTQNFWETSIPEAPMFLPEFPEKNVETAVKVVEEKGDLSARVDIAVECLPVFLDKPGRDKVTGHPFLYWTIRDYAEAYRMGRITPIEVAEHFISAIEDSQKRTPAMNLLCSFSNEEICKQAAASTQRFAEGRPLSRLDGIFIAVKDDIDCLPYSSKGGSLWVHKFREVKKDAICVARLRACGAILAGKTSMHELGLGTTGSNPLLGSSRNPHDLTRHTGGSSSGSAAIVSCGICPAALGTDDGGSIRIPASFCGVVGLKSTFGGTTLTGLLPVGCSMESVGPITGTVEDAILIYAAICGVEEGDSFISTPPSMCFPILNHCQQEIIRSLKIGKYSDWFHDVADSEIARVCDRTLTILSQQYGTQIMGIMIPELDEMRSGTVITLGTEFMNFYSPFYDKWRTYTSFQTRGTISFFRQFNASMYISAQRLRRRLMYYFLETLKKVDVIATPTVGMKAPRVPQKEPKSGSSNLESEATIMRFVLAGNYLGLPAISVPVGHDSNGLPIGLQLIGRPWQEATLLRLAHVIEELCLPSRNRPKYFYDILSNQRWEVPSYC